MEKIKNRFMLDTSVINRLADNPDHFHLVYGANDRGFEFMFTETQGEEINNNITFNPDYDVCPYCVPRKKVERMIKLYVAMTKVQTHYAGPIATLLPDSWKLDGTREFLGDDETAAWEMFMDIYDGNPKFYNDAMIALTGIHNGCTVVMKDGRFFKKMKEHFPGQTLNYAEFIDYLKNPT